MESPKSYAAKLLQSRQGGRRKLIVFGCLALAVVIVTTAVLALHAQAMNYTRRVLECAFEVHEHTLEECGMPDARTCGLADYVVHVHNGDCYDEYGALVCPLKEEREHKHTPACYEDQKVLTCELDGVTEEEAAALTARYEPNHVHTDECSVPGEPVLICGQEEREAHAHTEACFAPGEPVLTCGQEERAAHTHDGACYTTGEPVLSCTEEHDHTDACYTPGEAVLSCGQAEDAGHAHTDGCYSEGEPVLACGQDEHEAHAHTEACYAEGEPVIACGKGDAAPVSIPEHTHTEACYETVEELTCGKLELHTHTDDCYHIIKPEDPEYQNYKEAYPEEAAGNKEIRILECEIPQLEEHVHGEACFVEVELSPDEIAALKAQEMGIELHDVQTVYEDADVRVTVDYDTLSLVPQPAEVALLNAATPLPEPTPNPLLAVDTTEPEAADDAALPEEEGEPADEEPAAEPAETAPAAEPEAAAPEAQPAASGSETAAAPAAAGSEAPEVVRAGLMAEGREWLPAATVTYTVQYMDNGMPVGEAVQYVYTPGGEMPTFPRSIARYYREYRTDDFIVTARYTEFAKIPEEAELRASLISDEEQIAAYESAYQEALNTTKAQMLSLLDIGFWMDDEEVQPAAPVSITVQLLGEDGLPAGAPITVVHFAQAGAEVLPANVDESGTASFAMNGFSVIGLGYTPETDEEGRVTLDHTFDWMDENGLFQVTFHVTGIAGPYKEDAGDAADAAADEAEAGEETAEEAKANEEAPADGEEAAAGEPENADEDEANEPEDVIEAPLANASYLDFTVETLPDTDPSYAAYEQFAADEGNAEEFLNLAVMRYALTYYDVAMDLSACEIEVTITPTTKMELGAAAYKLENPADNGDDDGDGYVLAADGETLLPAPETETPVLFSVIAPAADGEELLSEQGTLEVGGEQFVEQLKDEDTAMVVEAVFNAAAADVEDIVPATVAQPEATEQVITFTIAPRMMSAAPRMMSAATDDTIGARTVPSTNPTFTVQYYAELNVLATKGTSENQLTLIDTTGGNLPKNGTTPSTKSIYLKDNVVATEKKVVEVYKTKEFEFLRAPELVYTDILAVNDHYDFYEFWVLESGKLATSTNRADWNIYTDLNPVSLIETTPEGVSYTRTVFEAKDSNKQSVMLSFTNNNTAKPDEGRITYIPLTQGSTIRWVYKVTNAEPNFPAEFYDYDISDGYLYRTSAEFSSPDSKRHIWASALLKPDEPTWEFYDGISVTPWEWSDGIQNNGLFMRTTEQGINCKDNYTGNGAKLAFGNVNTGTSLGRIQANDGSNINCYNSDLYGFKSKSPGYQGCSFGIVSGLNSNGTLRYGNGIIAPALFNEPESANITGKETYSDYTLGFERLGDTYTLSQVNGTVAVDLQKFNHPQQIPSVSSSLQTTIWTNNFWPMDSVESFGSQGHDVRFGAWETYRSDGTEKPEWKTSYYVLGHTRCDSDKAGDIYLPISDDGKNHNSYFGMHYEIDFALDESYVGPLEYLFFGDDDMWVFLSELKGDGTINNATTKLVCDLGGIHSSVGEYVNLWDHIKGKEQGHETKSYRLSFFYTERGASGSTCWMQFTLPEVSIVEQSTSGADYGSLRVGKSVTKIAVDSVAGDTETPNYPSDELFAFSVEFSRDDQNLPHAYSYKVYDAAGKVSKEAVFFNGNLIYLNAGEYFVIENIRAGTDYTVKEVSAKTADGKPTPYVYETTITNDGVVVSENKTDWIDKKVSGTISGNHQVEISYMNTFRTFRMPETGSGLTFEWYVFGGAALALAAAVVVRKRRKKSRA